jgi:hypothetical protein
MVFLFESIVGKSDQAEHQEPEQIEQLNKDQDEIKLSPV